jgi:hypothetical protein
MLLATMGVTVDGVEVIDRGLGFAQGALGVLRTTLSCQPTGRGKSEAGCRIPPALQSPP